MCSIFGAIGRPVDSEQMSQVADSMVHRGPDGRGEFLDESHKVSLGMTRLAILDVENGIQPFQSSDGTVIAICNGEIYNWQEIRSALEQDGVVFQTDCDAEILPEAWKKWGVELFSRLNGMFAIALYDQGSGQVALSRDSCGQKPLYYVEGEDTLHFSSEIKGLRAFGCELTLNQEAVEEYLIFRYVSQPRTMFAEVKQVEGGQYLIWDVAQKTSHTERWWKAPLGQEEARLASDNISELDQLTSQSVARALQSDVPIGMFLSAGVDSAVLLDAMRKAGQKNIKTFTAGFGAESDEVTQARELAERYGMEHEEVTLDATDLTSLPRVVNQMEVPVGDGLILAFDKLASKAHERGVKVILGGEGPDELFLGYSFQKLMWLAEKIGRFPRSLIVAGLQNLPSAFVQNFSTFPAILGEAGQQKVARWFGSFTYALDWWRGMGLRTVFEPSDLKALLVEKPPKKFKPPLRNGESLMERHYRQQFYDWLPDWSIIRQDRNTMAHSVEYRIPFLDPDLIEFSGRVPLSQKIRFGSVKWLWRQMAERRLGKSVANRTKQPFYFPIEEYAQSAEYQTLVETYLTEEKVEQAGVFKPQAVAELLEQAESGEFLPLKQVFSLLIFQIWFDEWLG